MRSLLLLTLLLLAGCTPQPKTDTGQPIYYDPALGISSDNKLYRR